MREKCSQNGAQQEQRQETKQEKEAKGWRTQQTGGCSLRNTQQLNLHNISVCQVQAAQIRSSKLPFILEVERALL